jgi:hypothetical protein
MYIDYFLKFESEAQAKAVLFSVVGAVEADPENGVEAQEGYELTKYPAVDMIGVIYKPTGQFVNTTEGDVPEMIALAGFHANVRTKDEAPELEPYRVYPVTPSRMWA